MNEKIVLKTYPFSDVVRACELKLLYDENISHFPTKVPYHQLTKAGAYWFVNHAREPAQNDRRATKNYLFIRKLCEEYLSIVQKEHPNATRPQESATSWPT